MSRTLSTHVSLWGEAGELVTLAPGENLPSWAEGRVGEHCLVPEPDSDEEQSPADEADPDPEADGDDGSADDAAGEDEGGDADADSNPVTEDQPDFTSSAPARRGRGRK